MVAPHIAIAAAPATHAVYFGFNSAALSSDAKATLEHLVQEMAGSPATTTWVVHGTTDLPDPQGTNETAEYYNETLAHARAKAVQHYLDEQLQMPVKEGAIRTFDKQSYDDHCATLSKAAMLACKQKGRRVEIEFLQP